MASRRSPLGPWMKVYVSVLDTKAHYSDAQFRALVELWALAVRQPVRGRFTNRSALDRRLGAENVSYLIEQGDLDVLDDGSVIPHRWDEYQSGVLSTGRGEQPVDSSGTVPEPLANGSLTRGRAGSRDAPLDSRISTSQREISPTKDEKKTTTSSRTPAREARNGHSPTRTVSKADFEESVRRWSTYTADEWRPFEAAWRSRGLLYPPFGTAHDDPDGSLRARLWRIAEDRPNDLGRWVRESPFSHPVQIVDYVFEQHSKLAAGIGVDVEFEGPTKAEAAAALTRIGDLLGSGQRPDHSLTVDETPDRESAAVSVGRRDERNASFLPVERVEVQRSTEPGESGAGREEALDGREQNGG